MTNQANLLYPFRVCMFLAGCTEPRRYDLNDPEELIRLNDACLYIVSVQAGVPVPCMGDNLLARVELMMQAAKMIAELGLALDYWHPDASIKAEPISDTLSENQNEEVAMDEEEMDEEEEDEQPEFTFTCPSCGAVETIAADDRDEARDVLSDEKEWRVVADYSTHICPDCAEDYVFCEEDIDYYHVDSCVNLNGTWYRESSSSVVYSNYQREYILENDAITTSGGDQIDRDTYEEDFFTCDSCGEVFHNDDRNHDEDSGDYLCEGCYDEMGGQAIKEYSFDVLRMYDAIPVPAGERVPYTYGVELEIEDLRHRAERINDELRDMAILKHDGSLSDGFEVVTVPAPLSWHMETMFTRERLGQWSAWGGRSFNTTTCGLHIHVGKKGISPLQMAKVLLFMNNPNNLPFIKLVAQRDINRWAAQKDVSWREANLKNEHVSRDKYSAVNVTKRATIEFRVFKGTLAAEGVHRALEFVTAVLEHSRTTEKNAVVEAHKLRPFLNFLCREARHYGTLVPWLARKGVLVESDGKYSVSSDYPIEDHYDPIVPGRRSYVSEQREAKEKARREREERERREREQEERLQRINAADPDLTLRYAMIDRLVAEGTAIPLSLNMIRSYAAMLTHYTSDRFLIGATAVLMPARPMSYSFIDGRDVATHLRSDGDSLHMSYSPERERQLTGTFGRVENVYGPTDSLPLSVEGFLGYLREGAAVILDNHSRRWQLLYGLTMMLNLMDMWGDDRHLEQLSVNMHGWVNQQHMAA